MSVCVAPTSRGSVHTSLHLLFMLKLSIVELKYNPEVSYFTRLMQFDFDILIEVKAVSALVCV